jgi:hypothetical protein
VGFRRGIAPSQGLSPTSERGGNLIRRGFF